MAGVVLRLLFVGSLGVVASTRFTAAPQEKTAKRGEDTKDLAKRCNPTIVRKVELKRTAIKFREGEKLKNSPIVSFQITESGDVTGIRLKRSSGVRDYDNAALSFVRSRKYNARPGCPTIDSTEDVIVDFR